MVLSFSSGITIIIGLMKKEYKDDIFALLFSEPADTAGQDYHLILLMADYVFGMTDSFAIATYKKLTGQELPTHVIHI